MLIGGIIYFCFGDGKIPELIILRKPYEGKPVWTEWIFRVAILLFFILTNIGLPVYNPGLRSYLGKYFDLTDRKKFLIASYVPFLFSFFVAILLPSILDMFWIIGLIFCNFNGFIIPAFMYYNLIKR